MNLKSIKAHRRKAAIYSVCSFWARRHHFKHRKRRENDPFRVPYSCILTFWGTWISTRDSAHCLLAWSKMRSGTATHEIEIGEYYIRAKKSLCDRTIIRIFNSRKRKVLFAGACTRQDQIWLCRSPTEVNIVSVQEWHSSSLVGPRRKFTHLEGVIWGRWVHTEAISLETS